MGFKRLTGTAGLAFVAFLLIQTFSTGQPPGSSAGVREVAGYYTQHSTALLRGDFMSVLAVFLFGIFIVGVWTRVYPGDREHGEGWSILGLVGAIGLGSLAMTETIIDVVLAKTVTPLVAASPATVGTLWALRQASLPVVAPFLALVLVGMGIAGMRSHVIPAVIAWLGFAASAVALGGAYAIVQTSKTYDAMGFISFLGFLVWTVAASIWLMMKERVSVPSMRAAPAA